MGGPNRFYGRIAELALGCQSRLEVRAHVLELLGAEVGFDKASITSFPDVADTYALGYERVSAFGDIPNYMEEFTPDELRAASQGSPILDIEALSTARRDRLALYREFVRPEGIKVFMTAVWSDALGVSGVTIARTGRTARFGDRDVSTLAGFLPMMRLADGYVGAVERGPASNTLQMWGDTFDLTSRERAVSELVGRGMTNREIATLLGTSPNTVRNQLAVIFRKAHVSTRAELAFSLAQATRVTESIHDREHRAWLRHLR
ncbi:MAG: helix-turn-helix transcriptional regulator [Polyangiaceae bacterium]